MAQKKIINVGEPHYSGIVDFYNSPQFKGFSRAALAKIITILKDFKIYERPASTDFDAGFHLQTTGGYYGDAPVVSLKSIDLSNRLGANLMNHLLIRDDGLGLNTQEIETKTQIKKVQSVRIKLQWDYQHHNYKDSNLFGERGRCRLLDAVFDTTGKLSLMKVWIEPPEIIEINRELTQLEKKVKRPTAKIDALIKKRNTLEKKFDERCYRYADTANLLYRAGHRYNKTKLFSQYGGRD